MKNIEDKDLLLAIANGDEQAFSTLYERYFHKLNHFLKRVYKQNEQHCSDILQEAFLRVWINRDKLDSIENFEAWIYKVVGTESLTFIRKEVRIKVKTEKLKILYDQEELPSVETPRFTELFEIKKLVEDTIRKMPDKRRQIYLLSREKGLSALEIAQFLNISPNTVYNTLTSALKDIRKSLSEQNFQVTLLILITIKLI